MTRDGTMSPSLISLTDVQLEVRCEGVPRDIRGKRAAIPNPLELVARGESWGLDILQRQSVLQ